MTNPDSNNSIPNNTPTKPNKPAPKKTQDRCYKDAFAALLNKLPKEDAESLLINLGKPNMLVRGQELWMKEVKSFVKEVVSLGESTFEAQT